MYKEFEIEPIELLEDYINEEYSEQFNPSVKVGIDYNLSKSFSGDRLQPPEPSEPINTKISFIEIVDDDTHNDETMNIAIHACIKDNEEHIIDELLSAHPEDFLD